MGISPKLLGEGERIIHSTRTHWKALILPVVVFLVAAFAAGFLLSLVDSTGVRWAIVAVAVVVVLVFSVWPFLVWLTASYTITNRRLINRSGVITRTGTDIPLYRINDVRSERGLIDRMLGCGTLIISAASELGTSTLPDVPKVEQVQLAITELLFPESSRRGDEGEPGQHPMEPGPRR